VFYKLTEREIKTTKILKFRATGDGGGDGGGRRVKAFGRCEGCVEVCWGWGVVSE